MKKLPLAILALLLLQTILTACGDSRLTEENYRPYLTQEEVFELNASDYLKNFHKILYSDEIYIEYTAVSQQDITLLKRAAKKDGKIASYLETTNKGETAIITLIDDGVSPKMYNHNNKNSESYPPLGTEVLLELPDISDFVRSYETVENGETIICEEFTGTIANEDSEILDNIITVAYNKESMEPLYLTSESEQDFAKLTITSLQTAIPEDMLYLFTPPF